MDDCPAILSLGILCSKQGWSYEWHYGKNPILSKGTKRIILTPHHDVPMVFAARPEQGATPCIDDDGPIHDPAARSSGEGRPYAAEEAVNASDIASGGTPSQAGEGRPYAPSDEDGPTVATRPKAKSKGKQRQKQRIVKSKFSVPPSARHNKFTHFPLDTNCEICKLVKCTRAACKTGAVPERDGLPPAQKFGDRLTADHKTLADDQSARSGARYALVIQDEYSKWIQADATKTKSHGKVVMALSRFMPLNTKPMHIYVDNTPELTKALETMQCHHDTCTPHHPKINGVVRPKLGMLSLHVILYKCLAARLGRLLRIVVGMRRRQWANNLKWAWPIQHPRRNPTLKFVAKVKGSSIWIQTPRQRPPAILLDVGHRYKPIANRYVEILCAILATVEGDEHETSIDGHTWKRRGDVSDQDVEAKPLGGDLGNDAEELCVGAEVCGCDCCGLRKCSASLGYPAWNSCISLSAPASATKTAALEPARGAVSTLLVGKKSSSTMGKVLSTMPCVPVMVTVTLRRPGLSRISAPVSSAISRNRLR